MDLIDGETRSARTSAGEGRGGAVVPALRGSEGRLLAVCGGVSRRLKATRRARRRFLTAGRPPARRAPFCRPWLAIRPRWQALLSDADAHRGMERRCVERPKKERRRRFGLQEAARRRIRLNRDCRCFICSTTVCVMGNTRNRDRYDH